MDILQLGLTLSTNHGPCLSSESISGDNYCGSMKKRRFEESLDRANVEITTLPRFENDDDDDDKNSSTINYDGDCDEGEGVVGWPPINMWRKKLCQGGLTRGYNVCGSGRDSDSNDINDSLVKKSKSTHIKVTMEGVGIGRKVDLSLHHSYHTLARSLFAMFSKDEECMKHYQVTYQDIEGDWLLAGDVPWSAFIESAQRLKLVRSNI